MTNALASRWRWSLVIPKVFKVCGVNYTAAMATDMGFLANGLVPPKEAFGMEFGMANPFALLYVTSLAAVAVVRKADGMIHASIRRTTSRISRTKMTQN